MKQDGRSEFLSQFVDVDKLILKFIQKDKETRIAKTIFKKEKKTHIIQFELLL